MEKPIILVDASAYLYRAYYAYPPLHNKQGDPTGCILGTLNMLKNLFLQYNPNYIGIIFDTKEITFRKKIYENYKINRTPMPKDLYIQIPIIHEILTSMGFPIFFIEGIEADDIIGTLTTNVIKNNYNILISSQDKDMIQLINPNVKLIYPSSHDIIIGEKEIIEKFHISPNLIIDYLALIGDKSDNIPGIPGIGPKTALFLLHKLYNFHNIFNNLDHILTLNLRGKKSIFNKLIQYKELAFMSYELIKINTNIPTNISFEMLKIQKPNINKLLSYFEYYELNTWLKNIKNITSRYYKNYNKIKLIDLLHYQKNSNIPNFYNIFSIKKFTNINDDFFSDYTIIDDIVKLDYCIQKIYETKAFFLHINIDKKNLQHKHCILNIGIAILQKKKKIKKIIYIPLIENHTNISQTIDISIIFQKLKKILENSKIIKIGYNFKLYYKILRYHYNIILKGIYHDVMLEAYILNNMNNSYNISELTQKFLNIEISKNYTYALQNIYPINFSPEEMKIFLIKIMHIILNLHNLFWNVIKKNNQLKNFFYKIEIPIFLILSEMEYTGVLINKDILIEYKSYINHQLEVLQHTAYKLSKKIFNIMSNKEVQNILYIQENLPIINKTPTGQLSINEDVLNTLSTYDPLPKIILKYRNFKIFKSHFLDKLLKMINPYSHRIHTSYYQTTTSTGRLSSRSPNLQNIPISTNTQKNKSIRNAFIAPPGYVILTADYSQIELRILAYFSKDLELIKAFNLQLDIHSATASEIFNIPLNNVTFNQRRQAKIINFGILYGMGAYSLSKKLSITQNEAQIYIKKYFEKFPLVSNYIKNIKDMVVKQGYVNTIQNRRIYFPMSNYPYINKISQQKLQRAAVNASIQGSSADIIKKAMINISQWIITEKINAKIIMQIHDELVFEVTIKSIEKCKKKIKFLMETCFDIYPTILQVSVGIGKNWTQAGLSKK